MYAFSTHLTQTDICREREPKKHSKSGSLMYFVGHLFGFDKTDSVNLLDQREACDRKKRVLLIYNWKVLIESHHSSTQTTSANHCYSLLEDNDKSRDLSCHPGVKHHCLNRWGTQKHSQTVSHSLNPRTLFLKKYIYINAYKMSYKNCFYY